MTATVVIESITTKDTTSPATTAETDEPLEEDSSPEAKEERMIYGVIEQISILYSITNSAV